MEHQELPARFIRQVGEFVEDVIDDAVNQRVDPKIDARMKKHNAECHVPPRRMDPPKALPFANQELDDVTLAQMVEMLEGQKLAEDVVFTTFDVPRTLALRCLADYKARVTRHILARAIA